MSNLIVARFMRKLLWGVLLPLSAVVLLVFLASQVEQRFFRRRAEVLLAQIQSLELGKTPWSQAKWELKSWNAQSSFDDNCNEGECLVDIRLVEPVYGFVMGTNFFRRMDDFIRRQLKLSYDRGPFAHLAMALLRGYMLIGGRPARVVALVGMRDGVVSSKGYSVEIQNYRHNIPSLNGGHWGNFALIAVERSVPEIDSSDTNTLDPPDSPSELTCIRHEPGCCDFRAKAMLNLRLWQIPIIFTD